MSILVISNFLLLLRDVDSNLNSLLDISNCSVEFEGPLWLLGDVVSLSHEVVYKFMRQSIDFDLAHHVYHVRDTAFSLTDVQFQSLLIVVTLLVVSSSFSPLGDALEELSDLQMLFDILFVNLGDDLCILIHLLMRLSDDVGLVSPSSSNQELNGLFLCSLSLTVACNHLRALW